MYARANAVSLTAILSFAHAGDDDHARVLQTRGCWVCAFGVERHFGQGVDLQHFCNLLFVHKRKQSVSLEIFWLALELEGGKSVYSMTVEKVAMAEKCNVCNVAVEASGAGITCDRCSGVLCSKQHLRTHLGKTGQRCLPYRVCRDDRRGRHLIATREIEPLELVLHDDPAVVGPATRTPPVCLGCMKVTICGYIKCKSII